jgi:hypothetical protein
VVSAAQTAMNLTTTEKNLLKEYSTQTRIAYGWSLLIRRRDPSTLPEADLLKRMKAQQDRMEAKIAEHDGLLSGLFRQMTASFGGLMKLDEKLKKKR